MKKNAFTILELVIVIIVIGILAAMVLPRIQRDVRQEAADNILSAIRYTQHLALIDDKTDPSDPNWQQTMWMIRFIGGSNAYYTISSDLDKSGSVEKSECAIDPANGKYLFHLSPNPTQNDESPNVTIGEKYGINSITPSGGCTSQHIAFDHLGRPHTGLNTTGGSTSAGNRYATYMASDCNLTFDFSDNSIDSFSIIVTKETGYAYIDGQENGS